MSDRSAIETLERCLACGGLLLDDDEVFFDAGGGYIHARCCGPERESYHVDGAPLKPGDPIPKPFRWGDI